MKAAFFSLVMPANCRQHLKSQLQVQAVEQEVSGAAYVKKAQRLVTALASWHHVDPIEEGLAET